MKQLMGLATALLCVSPLLAKPKPTIPVYVYIHEGAVQTLKTDTTFSGVGGGRTGSYSNTGSYAGVTVFINVSVNARTPDNEPATAVNDGKWCLWGDTAIPLDGNDRYEGLLQGDDITILLPDKNGKVKKIHFGIFDRKWRDLSEAIRSYNAQHP